MARIIIAEDESLISEMLQLQLELFGHNVIDKVRTGKEAVKACELYTPDVVFMDISMEKSDDGIYACAEIKKNNPDIRVIFLTAYPKCVYADILVNIPHDGYIEKPSIAVHIGNVLANLGYHTG
ncbi:MAG: hypothetical protein A2096_02365 [Spirochaetes bacterium GWF1_41_5]|nr:MAG: hypothetical protein A2096_02365 [Spirochaetes bacterium GWF1_41_5]HBE02749.1 hypothetical protein [Spirochaetia bacterium]